MNRVIGKSGRGVLFRTGQKENQMMILLRTILFLYHAFVRFWMSLITLNMVMNLIGTMRHHLLLIKTALFHKITKVQILMLLLQMAVQMSIRILVAILCHLFPVIPYQQIFHFKHAFSNQPRDVFTVKETITQSVSTVDQGLHKQTAILISKVL